MKSYWHYLFAIIILAAGASAFAGTASNIQATSGWQNCGSCAGINGAGPNAPRALTEYINNPSLDGKSSNYWIGGSTPYSDVLYWKELGGSTATHFVYDLYFYVKNPTAPQALEFDFNQSLGGHWYIFGTECNYRQYHDWRVWNTKGAAWINTGIPCSPPAAYTWNHLTLEFQRVNGMAKFISVTLNGAKHYINRAYYPKASSGYQTSVAFQEDGDYAQTNYSVWIDKMSLNSW